MPDSTASTARAPARPPLWRRAMRTARRASAGAGRALWLWWRRRTVVFRRTVRALVLVVATSALSLLVGLGTATAQVPLGPHEATWSTTLDSTITLDLGPLGMASMDSPAGILGLEVVPGEIPSKPQPGAADAQSVGQALSSDVASYIGVVSHPELTIHRGLHALLHDGLRRAGLIEALILCLATAGRLATTGSLRDTLAAGLRRRPPAIIASAAALCAAAALLVPAVRSEAPRGTTLAALEGTPLAQARFSGRIADVVAAYSPRVTSFLKDNEAFYSTAETNLRAAWSAAQDTGGLVDVTAAQGGVDRQDLDQRVRAVSMRRLGRPAPEADRPTDQPTEPATGRAADGTGAAPTPSGGPGRRPPQATGARAVDRRGTTTAVMSTDLHCNLDVIAFSGILDRLAGADIHMDDGDLTMTGSEPEQLCVDALSEAVPSSAAKVATVGNHDSDSTAQRLRSQGWTVTDGTIQTVGGLRILGDDDPDRTTATGTTSRRGRSAEQVGAGLAATSCTAPTDVVLIHQPATFGPLASQGCAPLLLAGHVHAERGMSTTESSQGRVSALVSGAGKGGTSLGPVTEDSYLHVLSFDRDGSLVAWRAVILHPDASVTVGAWQPVPPPQAPDQTEPEPQEASAAATEGAPEPDQTAAP
ncbi:metallophosphoesterase family protein [Actinomyces bowdenii]|uniref:metallophosphoesterase family protein n=1 Tax=Actinomyces bowdenii TaxID=131109 RepID=UPI00267F8781